MLHRIAITVFRSSLENVRQNLHRYRAPTKRLPLGDPSKTRDAIDVFASIRNEQRENAAT